MTTTWFGWTLNGAALLIVGLGLSLALRRQSAGTRRALWLAVFAGALVVSASPLLPDSLHLHVRPVGVAAVTGSPGFVPGTLALPAQGPAAPGGSRPTPLEARGGTAPLLPLLVCCWGVGALVLLLRQMCAVFLTRRLLRRARRVELVLFDELCRQAGIRRRAALLESSDLALPATAGIWRPVVALPRGWRAWPAARLRMVLCHELAHIRREDCLAQLLANVVVALHWHDPLVWLGARCFARERELAADDTVLLQGARPSSFARWLVELAGTPRTRPMGGAVGMAARSFFARRVESILAAGRRRTGSWAALLCAGAVVGGLTIGGSCVTTEPPPVEGVGAPGLALPPANRIERRIHRATPDGSAAAVVIGVTVGQGQRVVGVGRVRDGSPGRPDGNTVFAVGSITELFTGLAFADLLARGEVSGQLPVNRLLPPEARMPARGQTITLLDLATHRSGLPPLPASELSCRPLGEPGSRGR